MPALLEVRGLRKTFGRGRGALPAVRGVDMDVERGETVGVVGESGCGKTTLARMVAGLTPGHRRRHPLRRVGPRRILGVVGEPTADPNGVAFYKSLGTNALTDVYGISEQLRGLIDRGGYEAVRQGMPDLWIEDLTIAGSPEEVAAKIKGFYDVGADCVALFPMPSDQVDRMVQLTAEQVLPLLGTRD